MQIQIHTCEFRRSNTMLALESDVWSNRSSETPEPEPNRAKIGSSLENEVDDEADETSEIDKITNSFSFNFCFPVTSICSNLTKIFDFLLQFVTKSWFFAFSQTEISDFPLQFNEIFDFMLQFNENPQFFAFSNQNLHFFSSI